MYIKPIVMQSQWIHRRLIFKSPAGTSRGTLLYKDTWYVILRDENHTAIGEAGMFRGLSCDDVHHYEDMLSSLCAKINRGENVHPSHYAEYPSIRFALETALGKWAALQKGEKYMSCPWSEGKDGISVNGLIWMGDKENMNAQIARKIDDGYSCLKMKIGAIDFHDEISILAALRKNFSPQELTIRVDANGAFAVQEAMEKLKILSDFHLHSIEQPIRAGQAEEMSRLCETSPLPIALDEELIGCMSPTALLDTVRPQYIILKPSLVGGVEASLQWMDAARKHGVGYWVTSALESNVGLDTIARFTYLTQDINFPQGLGTGMLYENNIDYPFSIRKGHFHMDAPCPSDEKIYETLTADK